MLKPVTEEEFARGTMVGDESRLDFRARDFWRKGQNAFFDIRVTNPNSESLIKTPVEKILIKQEREKKNNYNRRIMNVEQDTFSFFPYTGVLDQNVQCIMPTWLIR